MSEEMKKVNETTEEMNETPATDQQKQENAAEDKKADKPGFFQKVKTFGKDKVIPAAKLVGKGVAKGASIAGGALATAYLIGMAIGGYTAVRSNKTEEESSDNQSADQQKQDAAEKPADQDVQVSLTEQNVQVETTIE